MIIAVVPVKDYKRAKQHILFANNKADGIELRLDFLQPFDLNIIATLRQECRVPVVFTLRKTSQGGFFYEQDEAQRLQNLRALCPLNPDYLDLEYDISKNFLQEAHSRWPHIKLICSYHDFTATPSDLPALLYSLLHPSFYAYKIAALARSTLDALRMLQFVNTLRKKFILTGICMGEDGQSTRILSPIVGNAMNYASVGPAYSMNGQLTLEDLLTVYHVRKLNSKSKIYALLGNPVDRSVGHVLHNQAIEFLQENAVYIKLRTQEEDLPQLLDHCRRLPFCGFSITMPLKGAIVPLLDGLSVQTGPVQAINTIRVVAEQYIGFNTDGAGAARAIGAHVEMAGQK